MPSPAESAGPILIAGGGIGGLAVSLALRLRGIPSVVCERAPDLREVGAGLLLSPNAVRVLQLLGVADEARAHSRLIDEWRILDTRGRLLHRLRPSGNQGLSALSLHRADLQKLLQSRLDPSRLHLGFEVAAFAETEDHVQITACSGARLEGSALIGADGLRSSVRRVRHGSDQLHDRGYSGWRSVVPFIPKGYEGGALSESWGEGKRFGISPLGDGRCYWYATANHPAGQGVPAAGRKQELLRLFDDWHSPIPELIAATENDSILLNPILDRPAHMRLPGTSRVTLLGDAAHPMTPNLGQGACAALEDAWVLARKIGASPSLIEGLRRYEALRHSRATWISRASHALGAVIQLEHPLATASRDLALRLTPGFLSDLTMRPLFSFRD
ncbi:MAG: FAD-dependent monooxygenase [Rariglobus sp.]|nr:FAD-dependent monooxygenase [Rariglobus sp.]